MTLKPLPLLYSIVLRRPANKEDVDGRVKPGHDDRIEST
jgi:hypothetical protein